MMIRRAQIFLLSLVVIIDAVVIVHALWTLPTAVFLGVLALCLIILARCWVYPGWFLFGFFRGLL